MEGLEVFRDKDQEDSIGSLKQSAGARNTEDGPRRSMRIRERKAAFRGDGLKEPPTWYLRQVEEGYTGR